MNLPETLALPRAKQESLHLQPRRVNLVPSGRLVGVGADDRNPGESASDGVQSAHGCCPLRSR